MANSGDFQFAAGDVGIGGSLVAASSVTTRTVVASSAVLGPDPSGSQCLLTIGDTLAFDRYAPDSVTGVPVSPFTSVRTRYVAGNTYGYGGNSCDEWSQIPNWQSTVAYGVVPSNPYSLTSLLVFWLDTTDPAPSPAGEFAYQRSVFVPSTPTAVGVPPATTGVVAAGWQRITDFSGAPTLQFYENSWGVFKSQFSVNAGGATKSWFGGSIGDPSNAYGYGMTLTASGAQSLDGAYLSVNGIIDAAGFTYDTQIGFGATGPASSAGAVQNNLAHTPIVFQLGNNYTWAVGDSTVPSYSGWVTAVGTPGESTITTDPSDPSCLVFVQRELEVGLIVGVLTVDTKTATGFHISSRDTTTGLVIADTAYFTWFILNPNWAV